MAVLNSKKAKLRELRDALGRTTSSCPEATVPPKDEAMDESDTENEDEGAQNELEEAAVGGSPLFTSQDFYSGPLGSADPLAGDQARGLVSGDGAHRSQSIVTDVQAPAVDTRDLAAALLSTASDYTSAPRRRRRL